MAGTVVKVVVIALAVVFQLAFGIAALVIQAQWNGTNGQIDPPCSTASPSISLSRWLLGFGCASIVIFAFWVAIAIVCLSDDKQELSVVVYIFGIVHVLFIIAWMVTGSVIVFRDCFQCQALAYSLWACSVACVVSMYIGLLQPLGIMFLIKE